MSAHDEPERSLERIPNEDETPPQPKESWSGVPRLSAYGTAAFALSVLALYRSSFTLVPFDLSVRELARELVPIVFIPFAAAATALWLSIRADKEIRSSDGRISGKALAVTARTLAIVALLLVPTNVALQLAFSPLPEGGGGIVEFKMPDVP